MIDPSKRKQERKEAGMSEIPEGGGSRTEFVRREIEEPAAVVGWEHFASRQKGTPGLLVRFVILEGTEAGRAVERNFWLTPAAEGMLADLALALGYEEPFDPSNDDHLERVFSEGAVQVSVKGEEYTNRDGEARTRYEAAFFSRIKGKGKKAWNDLVDKGQGEWQRYAKWRAQNPRPEPGAARPERARGGGGGGQGRSAAKDDHYDDDIPF